MARRVNNFLSPIGNSYFLFDYKNKTYSVGPHWYGAVFTIVVIFLGAYVNFSVLEFLQSDTQRLLIQTFVWILLFLTLLTFLLVALSDPGVLYSNFDSPSEFGVVEEDEERERIVRPHNETYCDLCNISYPKDINARHCEDCGVCIAGHDHHCPWIGKCIGKNNMKWFILFNICWIIYVIELIIVTFIF